MGGDGVNARDREEYIPSDSGRTQSCRGWGRVEIGASGSAAGRSAAVGGGVTGAGVGVTSISGAVVMAGAAGWRAGAEDVGAG